MTKLLSVLFLSLIVSGCNSDSDPGSIINPESSPSPSASPSSINLNANWTPEWNSIVAYWSLSNGSGPIENGTKIPSTVGMPGVANNQSGAGMAYEPLQIGDAISFNGVDNFIDLNTTPSLPSGYAQRTLCGWGNLSNTSGGYSWIASFGSPGGDQAMFIGTLGNTLVGGGYGDDLDVANFWQPGVWHDICLTYDGTNATMYSDGALIAGPTPKNWNLVKSNAYIGKQVNGFEYWNGSIAQVAIWNTALTASEIQTIYTTQAPAF